MARRLGWFGAGFVTGVVVTFALFVLGLAAVVDDDGPDREPLG